MDFKEIIKAYLDGRAKEDEQFAKTYAKPHKSIDECCAYLYQEIYKSKSKVKTNVDGRSAEVVGMSKEEIYGLAVHYYDEDSIKVDKPTPKVKVATSAKPTPKAESKSNVVDLFSKPKTEPKAEEKAQPKAKPQTKKEKALEGQLSLF